MGVLTESGVEVVHHYAPLHYLVFIARDRCLRSKPSLKAAGFNGKHLRSKSNRQDVERGFGAYAFMTIEQEPRITKAKLKAGFPHIGLGVPAKSVEATTFDLTRFNVAMTRRLRRGSSEGWPESEGNGRYYDQHQMPVARSDSEKRSLLAAHLSRNMIEVLVHGNVPLPDDTSVLAYSQRDEEAALHILEQLGVPWDVALAPQADRYIPNIGYAKRVDEFIEQALADPQWRGNGLEFDRV
ncbi:MAG TPA: hypothetical protein VF759_04605 [Allosphingosinicella sp.]|jgi:hypothetical protein